MTTGAWPERDDPDETGTSCAAFITRAEHTSPHTASRIERVLTENGFAYRHSNAFAADVTALGARQKFIRPHCPWQNGKVGEDWTSRSTGSV